MPSRCSPTATAATARRQMPDEPFELTVQLTDGQAWQLAQFLKRCGWTEYRACAADRREAYANRAALDRVQQALRDAGYSPR